MASDTHRAVSPDELRQCEQAGQPENLTFDEVSVAKRRKSKPKTRRGRPGGGDADGEDWPSLCHTAPPHGVAAAAANGQTAAVAHMNGAAALDSDPSARVAAVTPPPPASTNGAWVHVVADAVNGAATRVANTDAAASPPPPALATAAAGRPSPSPAPATPPATDAGSIARDVSASLNANSCASSSSTQSAAALPHPGTSNGAVGRRPQPGAHQGVGYQRDRPGNGGAVNGLTAPDPARPPAADARLEGSSGGADKQQDLAGRAAAHGVAAMSPTDSASSMVEGRQFDFSGHDGVAAPSVLPDASRPPLARKEAPVDGVEMGATSFPHSDASSFANGTMRNGKRKTSKSKNRGKKQDSASSASGSQGGRKGYDDGAPWLHARGPAAPGWQRSGVAYQQMHWNEPHAAYPYQHTEYGVLPAGSMHGHPPYPVYAAASSDVHRDPVAYDAGAGVMMMYGMPAAVPPMHANPNMLVYVPPGAQPGASYGREWLMPSPGGAGPVFRAAPPLPPDGAPSRAFVAPEAHALPPAAASGELPEPGQEVRACWKGNTCVAHLRQGCPYRHTQFSEECGVFRQTGACPHGCGCPYLHLDWRQPEICKFFANGDCRNGDKCQFRHPKDLKPEAADGGKPAMGAGRNQQRDAPPAALPDAPPAPPSYAPGDAYSAALGYGPGGKFRGDVRKARDKPKPRQAARKVEPAPTVPQKGASAGPALSAAAAPEPAPKVVLVRTAAASDAPTPDALGGAPVNSDADRIERVDPEAPAAEGGPAAQPEAPKPETTSTTAPPSAAAVESVASVQQASAQDSSLQHVSPPGEPSVAAPQLASPGAAAAEGLAGNTPTVAPPSAAAPADAERPPVAQGSDSVQQEPSPASAEAAGASESAADAAAVDQPAAPTAPAGVTAPPRSVWGISSGIQRIKQPPPPGAVIPAPARKPQPSDSAATAAAHPAKPTEQPPPHVALHSHGKAAATEGGKGPHVAALASHTADGAPLNRRKTNTGSECWKLNNCREYLKGTCLYSHKQDPERCPDFDAGRCTAGVNCRKMHILERDFCKFYLRGFCDVENCRFLHEVPEGLSEPVPSRPKAVTTVTSPRADFTHSPSHRTGAATNGRTLPPPASAHSAAGPRLMSDILKQGAGAAVAPAGARPSRNGRPASITAVSPIKAVGSRAPGAASPQLLSPSAGAARVARAPPPQPNGPDAAAAGADAAAGRASVWPTLGSGESLVSHSTGSGRWGDSASVKDKVYAAGGTPDRSSNGHE